MKKCGSCSKGSKVDEAHLTDTTILKKLTVDEKNDLNTTEGKSDQELTWQHLGDMNLLKFSPTLEFSPLQV
jgi:hypothetical protein